MTEEQKSDDRPSERETERERTENSQGYSTYGPSRRQVAEREGVSGVRLVELARVGVNELSDGQ